MTPLEAESAFSGSGPEATRFVSTGSFGLDQALGTGGWPIGQLSVIYGEAFTAKTTLALATVAEMQKLGTVAYASLDGDFNPIYAKRCGIDISSLVVTHTLPESGYPGKFIVVDSIGFWTQAAAVAEMQNTGATVVAVTQTRANINGGGLTPGLLEESSVRVRLSASKAQGVVAWVTRNPWNPFVSSCRFETGPDGIDRAGEIFRAAVREGLISTQGSWYYLGGDPLGQGRRAAQRALQRLPGGVPGVEAQLRETSRNMGLDTGPRTT